MKIQPFHEMREKFAKLIYKELTSKIYNEFIQQQTKTRPNLKMGKQPELYKMIRCMYTL